MHTPNITPIAMKCTKAQWEAIRPKLSNFDTFGCWGWEDGDYLVNNYNGKPGNVGNAREAHNRTVFETWDEKVFLEYCGIKSQPRMVTTEDIGAKVVRGRDWRWDNQDKGSVYGIITRRESEGWTTVIWYSADGQSTGRNGYRIGENGRYDLYYYEGEEIKPKQMKYKNYTISAACLLKIHAVACSPWKSKITQYMSRLDSEQNIEFSEEEINAMFSASNDSQREVLVEVFGNPQLNCPFKEGEIVWIWDNRDSFLKLGRFDKTSGRKYICDGWKWDNAAPYNNGQLPDEWKAKFKVS